MAGNPYLQDQANAITGQVNNNLQTNILPGIDAQAQQVGGYGGSRQGIAQGLAIGQSNLGLSSALSNLYGQSYQNDQNNQTQRMGIGTNYALGLGQQANNFYTQNRQLDQSGQQLGANLYDQGMNGALRQGQGQYGIGTQQQQAPWTATNNASNTFTPYTGYGGSQINTQNGSTLGALTGGALAGSQIFNNLGFGRNPYQSPYAGQGLQQNSMDYGNRENMTWGG